ncbi:MAG TPA: hypothetical protein VM529_17865, partial [Gemmata sp.]|nr:hypothetical protein [Gemmata sp.]
MRSLRVPALLLAALAAAPAPRADDPKPPAARSVEDLVADLGHPAFAAREKAQRELWDRGEAAIPALEKALADENPEVVRRATELLGKFAWGVRPDTPPEVLALLRRYQAGDRDPAKSAEVRKAAVLDLLRHGPAGVSVAKALLARNLPDDARERLSVQLTAALRREVPLRLFEGKPDEAADLIALHAAGTGPAGAADYAAFQVLRNNLPAATAAAEAAAKAGGRRAADQKLVLAHLYRAAGDWAKARGVAKDVPQAEDGPNVAHLLREDAGDWAALADSYPTGSANHPDALRLTFLRLAGRDREYAKDVEALLRSAREDSTADEVFEAVVALLSNHRADDATDLLLDRKVNLGLLGEVLTQRLRYKDALDLIESLEKPGAPLSARERLEFDFRRARVLTIVGRRGDAVQLFNKVAEGLQQRAKFADGASPIVAIRSLLRAEMRAGLKDLAAEHAGRFITSGLFSHNNHSHTGESAFEILFNADATAAETLFHALRAKRIPGDDAGPTITRVRDLLLGKADKAEADEALKALAEMKEALSDGTASTLEFTNPRGATFECRRHLATGAVCRAARRDADAEKAYAAAAELASDATDVGAARSWAYGTSDAFLPYAEWGDFLCDR